MRIEARLSDVQDRTATIHAGDDRATLEADEPGSHYPGVTPSVLVVDDENGVRDLMRRWLQGEGYTVVSAGNADEALGLMAPSPPAVAVCDIRMPGRDGLWLADRIRQDYPETAVIMATGVQDTYGSVASGLHHGLVDYLTKPFGRDRLREAVGRGVEWHRNAKDSRCWRERLEEEVDLRRGEIAQAIAGVRPQSGEFVDALLSSLLADAADAYAHAHRVATLSVSVARRLGMDDEEIATVRLGALLHDIGKLAMPDALLRKPAPLTGEEQQVVRQHPQIGAELLASLPSLAEAADIVRSVYERPDGRGYPAGLSTEAVSLGARIVAAADAYDAMTRPRVFCGAISNSDALLELERCSGTQFDPRVIRVLKDLLKGAEEAPGVPLSPGRG